MLNNNSNDPKASSLPDPKAAGASQPPVLDPHSPIETASQGSNPTTDPTGRDNPPPPYTDPDSLV